ncbi:MAG TPA: carbohydrate-binding protein, partial [Tepidisphaeraceae bacterium]|nr:carbohydrate-binding protein [Tepidisphaeraceae bacterium]
KDAYVGYCRTYDNPGAANKRGNGIVLGSVDNGTIERCVAYNNGADYTGSEGPAGIWTYSSNNITIQYNESYNNKTQGTDGDGFDLDQDVTNSFLQYNYSHGNDGAGFLVYDSGGTTNSNNVVRYNVSENDGRTKPYGGITVGDNVDGLDIYGNTVYVSSAASNPVGIYINNFVGTTPKNIRVRNNIIVTNQTATGTVKLADVDVGTGTTFQGNAYWTVGGSFSLKWGSNTRTTLADFRSSDGQEKNGNADTGFNVDPKLRNPGNGGTIGNADNLATLEAYKLKADSPLINAGLNLTASPFNLSVGTRDFYGNALPQLGAYDIGAHELSLYQAESATLAGGTTADSNNAGYTGTGFANLPATDGTVTFASVNAASAGTHKLTFRYANGSASARTTELKVNGVAVTGGLTFPVTGSWTTWSTVSVNVTLTAGNNTVAVRSTGQDGGNVDWMEVTVLANRSTDATKASASTAPTANEQAAQAFDGKYTSGNFSKWLGEMTSTGAWLQYDFGTNPQVVTQYKITSANDAASRDPKNWVLEATNDLAGSWTTLDTQSNQTFSGRYTTNTYNVSNTTSYRYYRLRVTANNGSTENPWNHSGVTGLVQLAELQLLA